MQPSHGGRARLELCVFWVSRGAASLSPFVFESLLLSLLGGLLGILLVLPLNGLESGIGNNVTFSETGFDFRITPAIIGIGLGFATLMGILGGLLPARSASKADILTALREL
jgi:putative ABC transport system permease protein